MKRHRAKTLQIALDAERHVALSDLKNSILMLLGLWIAYFVVINTFIQSLHKVTVPVVNLPLGLVLVVQGSVAIFLAALYLLIKRRPDLSA